MAWTYATLKQALQDWPESAETKFVSNIPIFVQQAEQRIIREAQLPVFRKSVTGVTTASDEYLGVPVDFLASYSLAVENTGAEFLIFKEVNFVREAYPATTTEGVPKYYAIFDDTNFILGPTPDAAYATELHYLYKPESIVTAGTSWLGTHAEVALFHGSLLEAQHFLKGDADLLVLSQNKYEDAIRGLVLLAGGYNKTDSYRGG